MNRSLRVWITVLCVAASAEAGPLINATGLSSPAATITFDEIVLAGGTLVTSQYSGLGVTFSPGLYYDSQGPATFPGVTTHYVGNNVIPFQNPFSIVFATPQTDAAFGFATNPATTLVEALLSGVVVDSFSQATTFDNASTAFLGFTGETFDEIRVTVGGDTQGLVDNIQMGTAATAPEPGTLALFGIGLAGLVLSERRFRSRRTGA